MKKFLALLLLATPCFAGLNQFPILNGQATNGTYADPVLGGTNRVIMVNTIYSTNDFDSVTVGAGAVGASLSNLAVFVRSQVIGIPVPTLIMGASLHSHNGQQTNWVIYSLQKSLDKTNWINWTNVSFQPAAGTFNYTNFNLTLGDYQYIRLNNISNTSANTVTLGVRSNLVAFYWKSVP